MTRILQQLESFRRRLTPAADDLLRDATYRRLWTSILVSSLGGQVTMLALPLTAAVLLHATPTQMGLLTAMEIVPFVLFSLPSGVWLDRVRKLPVYVGGEVALALTVASVPLAWALGVLTMPWMYVVAFALGTVFTTAGSAAQIVLTQVVPRERLVEAHAKNALAGSGAEVVGPGLAGLLIRLLGAPVALLIDGVMLLWSAWILRGIRVHERRAAHADAHFWRDLQAGLRFVAGTRLLVALAAVVGCWQMFHQAAMVVNILFATRVLGLSEQQIGGCFVALGAGTVCFAGFQLTTCVKATAISTSATYRSRGVRVAVLTWLTGARASSYRSGHEPHSRVEHACTELRASGVDVLRQPDDFAERAV